MSVRVIFVVLACFSVTDVRAQVPVPLTLENAIARGVQTSHRLAELDARRADCQRHLRGAVHKLVGHPLRGDTCTKFEEELKQLPVFIPSTPKQKDPSKRPVLTIKKSA